MDLLHLLKLLSVFLGLLWLIHGSDGQEMRKRKQAGVTFAFPGLNLLGGGLGNNNNGGNIFGQQTFTRTVVSTVSTITTASYRTCTTSAAALMPCAGRRKRDAADQNDNNLNADEKIENIKVEPTATPEITLVIGTTTISDSSAVSDYLEANKPSSQSLIYPKDYIVPSGDEQLFNVNQNHPTLLYPSHDTAEDNTAPDVTTEIPISNSENDEETTPKIVTEDVEKARLGITTTVTTVIRVTSVATTIASGAMATLQITYGGCSPQTFPVSGIACGP